MPITCIAVFGSASGISIGRDAARSESDSIGTEPRSQVFAILAANFLGRLAQNPAHPQCERRVIIRVNALDAALGSGFRGFCDIERVGIERWLDIAHRHRQRRLRIELRECQNATET